MFHRHFLLQMIPLYHELQECFKGFDHFFQFQKDFSVLKSFVVVQSLTFCCLGDVGLQFVHRDL